MKKIIRLLCLLFISFINAQVSISPSAFEVDDSITITVDLNNTNTDCNGLNNPSKIYMHSGIGDNSNAFGFNVIGNWGMDDGVGEMSNNGNGTWSITITPESYYGLNTTQAANATQIGLVFRNADGSEELKANGCDNFTIPVGIVIINIIEPTTTPIFLNSGDNLSIKTNLTFQGSLTPSAFEIYFNNTLEDSGNGFTTFLGTINNITANGTVKIIGSPLSGPDIGEKSFDVIIAPTAIEETIPNGLVEGINYNNTDATKATLVLSAPFKDFVYVAGSFNNYNPDASYLMKKDPASGKFWLKLEGLTPGKIETYQYWINAVNPIPNSPSIVKTADPYSTLVLSPFDDPSIPASSYPNLPSYPSGQEREVTVLQTNKTSYNWQVSNFSKPKKEDLIIYEVLVRDFDTDRNFQNIIDRIDYFKNLNINAIELMPIMEFEGNESWGYNTAFHMALDKFYGTEDKLKELIDTCHQNGIAVILDIALNHAFGRNPMVRMWMNDPDGDGWGEPSSENPYFNTTAKHAFSVGSDFDHSNSITNTYTKRVVKHWIEEFKIDGFRWDLTKGFTQNCTSGDEGCTNSYQQDRVDILKQYADYSWSLDETHYVIFEHLGQDQEEQQWANYRVSDVIPKGVMMWGVMHNAYKEFGLGFNSDISRATSESRGFTNRRLVAYPESHDEERLMYDMLQFGSTSNSSHNVRNLNTALSRMSAIGATSLLIPGPKMIWHFGALGMENSIFTCSNSTVSNPNCKLDTKPQPQWSNNWLADANRNEIYNDWARLNQLKINEDVFEGDFTLEGTSRTVRLFIKDDALPTTQLKNVVVLANFHTSDQNITPDFPYTGTWYDLMDNTSINISSTTASILIPAGQFRVFGNQVSTLSINDFKINLDLSIYPNPTSTSFQINKAVNMVSIYNMTGKIIKTFKGGFSKGSTFDISNLSKSIYLVKIVSDLGEQSTLKIVRL